MMFLPYSTTPDESAYLPSKTGTQYVTDALREIKVLDPIATAEGEKLEDGLRAATDLLDTWRTERLTIGGVNVAVYSLVSGQQSYTIGPNGEFDQAYPNRIDLWSVIPDDDAASPIEIDMGRPLTVTEWQQVRLKSQTSPRPTSLYFDDAYAAGLGNILVHPIPDNNNIDIKLYQSVPTLVTLVADTTYYLRPGMQRALTLGLAVELCDRYEKPLTPRLEKRATEAFAKAKRFNIKPNEAQIRPEFLIGQGTGRRTFNIYTGGR